MTEKKRRVWRPEDASIALQVIKAGGGAVKLARAIGVTRQMIHQWKMTGRVTGDINLIAQLTGIPRSKIRPDLYPPEMER